MYTAKEKKKFIIYFSPTQWQRKVCLRTINCVLKVFASDRKKQEAVAAASQA
jgi:hypothetical protein